MVKRLIFTLVGCLITMSSLFAQNGKVEVTGVVIDEDSVPVAGAGVVLKGTTIGISTDVDGNFRLEFDDRPDIVLEFSFIGMKTQEVKVSPRHGKAKLEIVMEMDQNELDQVVVTGIFNRDLESYTGSVVTMKGEDIKKVSSTNIAKAISAIDPSFRVMDNFEMGSDPNRLPDMRMRGTSTLPGGAGASGDLVSLQGEYDTYPNQPLLMLDGFEIDVQTMADLDPDRIASITILKDASATAIYGSKASNGVIVIETLAPRPGAINVTYSGNVRVEIPDLTSYNLMNSEEKIEAEWRAGLYSQTDLASLRDYQSRLREVRRGVDTYWLSQPLRTSVQHRHAVTLEGGSQALRYKLYAGLNETPGVMKGSKRSTQTASLDLSYRFNKFLLKNSVTVDNAVGTDSPYGSFSQYAMLNPYLRPYDENGNVDPAKAAPITFDPFNNTCLRLGEKVGNAFSDGKRIKLLPQGYSGQR